MHSIINCISKTFNHAHLNKWFLWNLSSCFLDFLACAMFHKKSNLYRCKAFWLINVSYLSQILRSIQKKSEINSWIINSIQSHIYSIKNKELPHMTSINPTSIYVGKHYCSTSSSAIKPLLIFCIPNLFCKYIIFFLADCLGFHKLIPKTIGFIHVQKQKFMI